MASAKAPVKPVDESKAEEYRQRAEADFDPNETAKDRLERLKAEVAVLEKETAEKEQKEAAAKMAPAIAEVVKLLEAQNPGKVCRQMSIRYVRPGDEVPEVVTELEQGKPGIVVKFRVVTPRAKKEESSKSE